MTEQFQDFDRGILADRNIPTSDEIFNDPSRFVNRELSWLEFNRRVLEEAQNTRHPLLERVKFLSISASNLDEFFMVRVAGLNAQKNQGVGKRSDDGMSVDEQLEAVYQSVELLQADQQAYWANLQEELVGEGIYIKHPD